MSIDALVNKLHWLGHDSFWLDGPPILYFDPWKLRGKLPIADLILVSHQHSDHCSPDDIHKISGPHTRVVASAPAAEKLPGACIIAPGNRLEVSGVTLEAVPAYNVNKFRAPELPFHPKDELHVGYIITMDGVRLYFAGDTDAIPEMRDFACDIALLPVSGTYVMTVEEAVAAAQTIHPRLVIPMHYGAGIGAADDGQRFASLYPGETKLLTAE